MIESLSSIQNFNSVNPFSRVDTANGMPINNYRMVELHQIVSGQKNLSQKKILEIYTLEALHLVMVTIQNNT